MTQLSRRGFIALTAAAGAARGLPQFSATPTGRRVLTLVYDKSLGMMRAIDRLVP